MSTAQRAAEVKRITLRSRNIWTRGKGGGVGEAGGDGFAVETLPSK